MQMQRESTTALSHRCCTVLWTHLWWPRVDDQKAILRPPPASAAAAAAHYCDGWTGGRSFVAGNKIVLLNVKHSVLRGDWVSAVLCWLVGGNVVMSLCYSLELIALLLLFKNKWRGSRFNKIAFICEMMTIRDLLFVCRRMEGTSALHRLGAAVAQGKWSHDFIGRYLGAGRLVLALQQNCQFKWDCGWIYVMKEQQSVNED